MDQTKNSDKQMIQNNENYSSQQNKIIQNEYENEKEEDNEIIIELQIANDEISKDEEVKQINILCDKDQLIAIIKKVRIIIKKLILIHQKNLIILIKIIQNYI